MRRPALALTFDDGPTPCTDELVDLLGEYGAAATFFVVGSIASERAATLRAAVDTGCELGNHTFSHARLSVLAPEAVRCELVSANEAIVAAAGVVPSLMRPPFGAGSPDATRIAQRLGMATVMWTSPTGDWTGDPADVIAERILKGSHDGAVIVLHDGDAVNGSDRAETVKAVAMALPELSRYRLVTVSSLFEENRRVRKQVVVRPRGVLARRLGVLRPSRRH